VLGEIDVFEDDDRCDPTHETTGIQVSLSAAEAVGSSAWGVIDMKT
jgi:hypothetical protein